MDQVENSLEMTTVTYSYFLFTYMTTVYLSVIINSLMFLKS